jgi:ubiquitin C-terminal hydrolase
MKKETPNDEILQKIYKEIELLDPLTNENYEIFGILQYSLNNEIDIDLLKQIVDLFADSLRSEMIDSSSSSPASSSPSSSILESPSSSISESPSSSISESPSSSFSASPSSSISESDDEYSPVKNIKSIPISLLQGMKNVENSCFLDSVIVPILLNKNGYLAKNFVAGPKSLSCAKILVDQLRLLSNNLFANTEYLTCIPLKSTMKQCGKSFKNILDGDQQDSSEFLIKLMEIFNIVPIKIRKELKYKNAEKETVSIQTSNNSVIQIYLPGKTQIQERTLLSFVEYSITEDFSNVPEEDKPLDPDNNRVNTLVTTETILDSPVLIFTINRRQENIKNTSPIKFTEYIKNTTTNKILYLSTIVIHSGSASGGHYTSFFKNGQQWFYYNDIAKRPIIPVSWSQVYTKSKNNCTIFIYE